MEYIIREVKPNHTVRLISCTHGGTVFQHTEGINELIEEVATTKNDYLLHHGDWIDALMANDKRFCLEGSDKTTPIEQAKREAKRFKPIAKRMIAGLIGNHEFTLINYGNLAKLICDDLGIPYGTLSCVVDMQYKGKTMYKIFATHMHREFSGIAKDPEQNLANRKAKAKQYLKDQVSDCCIMSWGHPHQLAICPPSHKLILNTADTYKDCVHSSYSDDAGNLHQVGDFIPEDNRYYCVVGGFYKLYSRGLVSYAEMKGLKPTDLGHVKINVNDCIITSVEAIRCK
jgi:predicted phosphodiesterase